MRSTAPISSTQSQVILHPIVCAVYPVVFLYTANKIFFDFSVVIAPALALAATAALLWALLTRFMGDVRLAALFTTMPLLVCFSYGAVEQVFRSDGPGPWRILISVCVAAVCLAALALLKWRHLIGQVTYACNVVSLVLVAAPLFQAGMWQVGIVSARSLLPLGSKSETGSIGGKLPEGAPDIYYFVMDAYGREDVLRTEYGFDNTGFISDLGERGFYVADQAIANYPYTLPSMTSTLNLAYLHDLFGEDLGELTDRKFLRERLVGNRAVNMLQSAGHSIVSFSSQYSEIDIGAADIEMREWWFPSEFVIGLAGMTPLPSILTALGKPLFFDLHRYRTLYPLERMEEAIAVDSPKFVFVHLLYGHPPFVFGPEGERIANSWNYTWDDGTDLLEDDAARAEYIESYAGQAAYLNKRLLETVDEILAGSKRAPVIVIHGDHGPGSRYSNDSLANTDVQERFSIFYAALLPNGGNDSLYPSISPVNGMRLIFNRYFGANYSLLEDASFFNGFSTPYRYTRIDESRLRVAR